jgi:hypothetical protein
MDRNRWWPTPLSAWRGAAFNCCLTHRMIARVILVLPNVLQQAAPENVSTRELHEAVFDRFG